MCMDKFKCWLFFLPLLSSLGATTLPEKGEIGKDKNDMPLVSSKKQTKTVSQQMEHWIPKEVSSKQNDEQVVLLPPEKKEESAETSLEKAAKSLKMAKKLNNTFTELQQIKKEMGGNNLISLKELSERLSNDTNFFSEFLSLMKEESTKKANTSQKELNKEKKKDTEELDKSGNEEVKKDTEKSDISSQKKSGNKDKKKDTEELDKSGNEEVKKDTEKSDISSQKKSGKNKKRKKRGKRNKRGGKRRRR